VLCGDFNSGPRSRIHRRLRESLRDVTAPSPIQLAASFASLDHVFLSAEFVVHHVEVVKTPLTRVASDHYPLLVDLSLPG